MKKEKFWELFWYCFFGAVGTLVNILIFYLLSKILNVHYLVSNLAAWIFSVAFAFVTNKIWVFKSKSWSFSVWFNECIQFVFARIGTCVFDMGYMFFAISIFTFDETISKVVTNFIVVVFNYIISKIWIFKENN